MEIKQAIEIIKEYGSIRGMNDILATLEHMDEYYVTLSPEQLTAFTKFVTVGKKFFSPVEEA